MSLPKRIARPIYRKFFEQPLWWFLAKVKVFFMAETLERLASIEHRLHRIEHDLQRMETGNAAQWTEVEHLLLALFRQPLGESEFHEDFLAPHILQPADLHE